MADTPDFAAYEELRETADDAEGLLLAVLQVSSLALPRRRVA